MSALLQRIVFERSLRRSCLPPLCRRSYAAVAQFSAEGQPQDTSTSSTSDLSAEQLNKIRIRRPKKEKVLKEEGPPRPNLLERTKVEDYLDHIASTKKDITLADLESCKPEVHGEPGTSYYEADYNALLDNVVRSFSARQLRHFARLYNLRMPTKSTKWDCAVAIIERQWDWPSLTEIQKQQRDWTEVSFQSFPLDPRQCFLLLGKDGVDLLNLSSQYNVHISLSARPLCIKVEGLLGAINKLAEHIAWFKEDIQREIFELPRQHELQSDLLQRISRLSNAYVEDMGHGKVCISHRKSNPSAFGIAKHLFTTAICEKIEKPSLLSYTPKSRSGTVIPPVYSLYPFLAPLSVPWTTTTGGLFRARRVGDWLGTHLKTSSLDNSPESGGIIGSGPEVVALDQRDDDVKTRLLSKISVATKQPHSTTSVVASLGHMLWVSPNRERSLLPPLKGSWQFSKILEWIKNHGAKYIFIPGAPRPLLGSAATQQRVIHRLVYNAIPDATINVSKAQDPVTDCIDTITFEVVLGSKDYAAEESAKKAGSSILEQKVSLEPSCRIGAEAKVDLMIPDCPMDVQFRILESESLPKKQWPAYLKEYFSRLEAFLSSSEKSQPDTPLLFKHGGNTYTLKSSTSVRQSVKQVITSPTTMKTLPQFEVITESITNTESNEKSTSCQVICDNVASESLWKTFMNRVDWLASQGIQSLPPSERLSVDLEENINELAESTVEAMLERMGEAAPSQKEAQVNHT